MAAILQFEAVEANIVKIERLWREMQDLIPSGIDFSENPEYEKKYLYLSDIVKALPKIDGWGPTIHLLTLDEIGQSRMEAKEASMIEAEISVEKAIYAPGKEIREYRFRFDKDRRALIRDALAQQSDAVEKELQSIRREIKGKRPETKLSSPATKRLSEHIDQIDALLGSSVTRPPRWSDLQRHLGFGQIQDFQDITLTDWPMIRGELSKAIYGANDPLPLEIEDLGDIIASKPGGAVTTRLNWDKLNAEDFERLIFQLVSETAGYENPEWLMKTNAPDRGRDISVFRVESDPLGGKSRQRMIIQCKHWLAKSVKVQDIALLREQMSLWGEPRVDILVIATSGRFAADAVSWIEKHNVAGNALKIWKWPESHLERLLASRPALIAEFSLR